MVAAFRLRDVEIIGLPPRQAETLAHTVLGRNSKETAKAMGISHRTVEMNLNLLMARLGAANRTHAIWRALEEGLLRRVAAIALFIGTLAFGSTPTPLNDPDDMARTVRTLRVRRRNETTLTITHTLEDDA